RYVRRDAPVPPADMEFEVAHLADRGGTAVPASQHAAERAAVGDVDHRPQGDRNRTAFGADAAIGAAQVRTYDYGTSGVTGARRQRLGHVQHPALPRLQKESTGLNVAESGIALRGDSPRYGPVDAAVEAGQAEHDRRPDPSRWGSNVNAAEAARALRHRVGGQLALRVDQDQPGREAVRHAPVGDRSG